MRILITNDDGIQAEGLRHLIRMALNLGEVWVVAPDEQCSAMAQRIKVRTPLTIKKVNMDIPGLEDHAFSLSGTPADCVKVAVNYIMRDNPPDYVFSGINYGYNMGFDIAYSGTVCAALEAVMQGIPAIAFSTDHNGEYGTTDSYILSVTKDLLNRIGELQRGEIWNVNFPGIPAEECKGILQERVVAQTQYILDNYAAMENGQTLAGSDELTIIGVDKMVPGVEAGTDIDAVNHGYISIGKLHSFVMKE